MATIRIPTPLRKLTQGKEEVTASGATIGALIANLETQYPGIKERICDDSGQVRPFSGETSIFITPGYRFRAVDLFMTNFHLPRSTLFMLVAAFSGLETMQRAYAHAIASGYRFYSYGDASLLFPA